MALRLVVVTLVGASVLRAASDTLAGLPLDGIQLLALAGWAIYGAVRTFDDY